MERDDLLLHALAEGATGSAALAARTGLSPASVWRGLRHLMDTGHVFSGTRGVYRLTPLGEAVLAALSGTGGAGPARMTHETGPGSPVVASIPEPDHGAAAGAVAAVWGDRVPVGIWLVGGALVALGVGVIAHLATVARRPAPAPPPVPPPAPIGWPYSGQNWVG